ncbi:MAG: tRNA(His) guanylyltransferase Thg1 family protein [Thermofilum sp.]
MSYRELLEINVPELERRFKAREAAVESRVSLPFALRLDGVGFGKSLAGFEEPRDHRVHKALVEGAVKLLTRFSASGAYVISDEVNLLLLGPSVPYAGRVEKLVSISASILSASVSLALGRSLIFDSRVVPLEGIDDAKRYVLYRARVGFNNYVGSTLRKLGVRVAERTSLPRQIEEIEKAGVRLSEKPLWEWGGSCVFWRIMEGKRNPCIEDGPWRLLEEVERYRAPELDQRKS